MMAGDEGLDQQIAIRLTSADLDRLEALAEKIPVASRNAIARAALRIGLEAIEKDPTHLFAGAKKSRARKR